MSQLGERQYFLDEVHRFFELIGTATFWDLPAENQEGAVKGLLYAYFNTEHGDKLESDAAILQAALTDYDYRRAFVFVQELHDLTGVWG